MVKYFIRRDNHPHCQHLNTYKFDFSLKNSDKLWDLFITLNGRRQAKKKRTTVPNMMTICCLPLVTAAGSDCPRACGGCCPCCWICAAVVLPACLVTATLAVRCLAMIAYRKTRTNSGNQKNTLMMDKKNPFVQGGSTLVLQVGLGSSL